MKGREGRRFISKKIVISARKDHEKRIRETGEAGSRQDRLEAQHEDENESRSNDLSTVFLLQSATVSHQVSKDLSCRDRDLKMTRISRCFDYNIEISCHVRIIN